jgi:hypothetical protein
MSLIPSSGFVSARCASIALLLLAAGCIPVGWHRTDLTSPFKRREQVKVWSRGNVERWHAVVFSRDSISGIPYKMPVDCDRCRRSVALTEVDSLRTASPLGFWVLMAVCATGIVYGVIHAK